MELIKDFITSALIVICIVMVLFVIFYDQIPLNKVIPEVEEYNLTPEMKNELENDELAEIQEVIVDYYIDATDLNTYEQTNEYVGGKSNPFAAPIAANETNNNSNSNQVIENNNSNSSSGFYEDDGTK